MDALAAFHIVVLGFWGGVVAVEILFETGGMLGKFPPDMVAKLHRHTDRILEVPLLIAVLASGLLLWQRAGWSAALLPKVALGTGAVAANAVCVVYVERRAAARAPDAGLTRRVVATAIPGFPLAAAALIAGGLRAGWW